MKCLPSCFSVRLAMAIMAFSCVALAWIHYQVAEFAQQSRLVRELEEAGFTFTSEAAKPNVLRYFLEPDQRINIVGVRVRLTKVGEITLLEQIQQLPAVQFASVSDGSFEYRYADEIAKWPSLRRLRLQHVHLQVTAISRLSENPHLKEIILEDCCLDEGVVDEMCMWNSLEMLSIRRCNMSDVKQRRLRDSLSGVVLFFGSPL